MPKVALSSLPVSALFGVNKPSGPPSMSIVNDIKSLAASSRLFADPAVLAKGPPSARGKARGGKRVRRGGDAVKIGQGGTLDPLADGVLVVGIGRGTKRLSEFLDCVKEYRTTALLGCETDSYDSEGSRVRTADWRHVTREKVEAALAQFRGPIQQAPPIFSALKMDGMPLYEYARRGIPLPRPIERRGVTVHAMELEEWIGNAHTWRWPEKALSADECAKLEAAMSGAEGRARAEEERKVEEMVELEDKAELGGTKVEPGAADGESAEAGTGGEGQVENEVKGGESGEVKGSADDVPTAFVIKMRVSGGTYVRSIVHDLGHALGSAAHVVTLQRSRQGRFTLDAAPATEGDASPSTSAVPAPGPDVDAEPAGGADRECVPWSVFERALEDPGEPDAEGWHAWEREVMRCMEIVPGSK